MTNLPIVKYVYDRRKRATSKKEGAVELEITFERRRRYMTTGVRVLPKQWRNGGVVGRIDALELNMLLNTLMVNVRKVMAAMVEEGTLCLDDIPGRLKALQEPEKKTEEQERGQTFIEFCEERTMVRKYGKTADSQERYERFMRFFRAWGGIREFKDITEANIIRMDEVLAGRGLKDCSKWNNYHRFLNSYIIDAVDDGLVKRNPYKHVRINKDKSSGGIGKYLTPQEFRRIERMECPTRSLERVRDLFVFQTYTCLSYVDLAAFDAAKTRRVNGREVYVGNRGKTKQEFVFVLLKPARDVLDKYDGVLPLLSNVKYNQYLKALMQHAGIDKPVSSHWARHTGATLLLNMNVNMEVVAKVLGHSSTQITRQIYAKLLDETVVEAMSSVEGRMMG